jgi:Na+/H+ antiporter NhaA
LTIKSKIAERPAGATSAQRYRADRRCGIDFAINLFVRSRVFEPGGLVALTHDRLGILLGTVALVIGDNWGLLFSADFEPDDRPGTLGRRRAFGALSRRR